MYRCTTRALDFLEKYRDEDFFLTVSYDGPHGPSLCPAPKLLEGKSMLKQIYDTTKKVNDIVYTEFTRSEIDHDGFGGHQINNSIINTTAQQATET